MDYKKIGNFIMTERKAKNLTQSKLAEKLFVSEKTISKWENGNGIPETNILPKICELFEITLNELLSGERISSENYQNKAEEQLLELQKQKEIYDKKLFVNYIVISLLSLTLLISLTFIASFLEMKNWLRISIIVFAFVVSITGLCFALKIEQTMGYYECEKCNHKHISTYSQVFFAPHIGLKRYLKCPHCGKKTWNKKLFK